MLKKRFALRLRQKLAIVSAVALAAAGLFSASAHADPNQYTAFVGAGSDTSQDVMAAMTGFTNGNFYEQLNSGAPNYRVVASFEATGPLCYTWKINGPTLSRPNGSSEGRRALSRAYDGLNSGYGDVACNGPTDNVGQIDFARSSSGPSSSEVAAGSELTYIPFGRDGVSFAVYRASGGAATTSLTSAQLQDLFENGPTTINGITTYPCGIQQGSGTYSFWNKALGLTEAEEEAGTQFCNDNFGGRSQENDGDELKARGDAAPAGSQVVIGFSAGSFISKSNLVAAGAPPAGVQIGSIDGQVPVNGTAPNLTPNSAFYASTTYGRDIYNVFPTSVIDNPFLFQDIKNIFKGSGAAICNPPFSDTVEAFGFQSASNCGDSSIKATWKSGQDLN